MKKLVVMFPGVGYNMDCPLMYYASFLYEANGYEQIHMKYNSIFFEPDLTREEKDSEGERLCVGKGKGYRFFCIR